MTTPPNDIATINCSISIHGKPHPLTQDIQAGISRYSNNTHSQTVSKLSKIGSKFQQQK